MSDLDRVSGKMAAKRMRLIEEVSDKLYVETGTFEGQLGLDLAYLYPAIAKGTYVEWDADSGTLELFRELFPEDHDVWLNIQVMSEEERD